MICGGGATDLSVHGLLLCLLCPSPLHPRLGLLQLGSQCKLIATLRVQLQGLSRDLRLGLCQSLRVLFGLSPGLRLEPCQCSRVLFGLLCHFQGNALLVELHESHNLR